MTRLLTKKLEALNRQNYGVGKKRKKTFNLSREDRRAQLTRNELARKALWADVKDVWVYLDDTTKNLSAKHNVSYAEMRRRLQRLPKYGPRRRVNVYNAVLHVRSLEINEGFEPGQKKRLEDLRELAKQEDWRNIPKEDLNEMVKILEGKRELEKRGMRSQPSAVTSDFKNTSKNITNQLEDCASRCKIAYAMFMVRTNVTQAVEPYYTMDQQTKDFFELFFNMTVDEFSLKLDAYNILGIPGVARNATERINLTRGLVRQLLTRGLRDITGLPDIIMQWTRYEVLIVEKHKVILENWPLAIFEVEGLGLKNLEFVLDKIQKKECKWRRLGLNEITEHSRVLANKRANGEIRMRKNRSDVGKKRGSYKKCDDGNKDNDSTTTENLSTSGSSSNAPVSISNNTGKNNDGRKRRSGPLSREILSDTDLSDIN